MTPLQPSDWHDLPCLTEPELLKRLAILDAQGVIMAPDESLEQFALRLDQRWKSMADMTSDTELATLFEHATAVPMPIADDAAELLQKTYAFCPRWIQPFFDSSQTGRFSAGVTLEIDELFPLIFLNGEFKNKSRYGTYERTHTLAHEMLHAIRMPLASQNYDEFFPWQLSASPFRRAVGNAFRRWYIPAVFFAGITAAVCSLAVCTSLLWSLLLPAAVILRELQLRQRLRNAEKNLRARGLTPMPMLARLDDHEIAIIARASQEKLAKLLSSSPRWKMLTAKFSGDKDT